MLKRGKKLKKPYLSKCSTVAGFTVWVVDGEYVREHLNHDFTNFGQHYRFKFIPKNEFWIDKEAAPGEERFFIDHLLVEHRWMAKGMKYNDALDKAEIIEKRERSKSRLLKGIKKNNAIKKIHKRLLKSYSGNISVWIVSGELVRDIFMIDFTEGGHDRVYSFIPKNEVWIDDDLSPEERKFVILHELHERHLMAKGLDYGKAHDSANEVEYHCRRHPRELGKKLKSEIKKNR